MVGNHSRKISLWLLVLWMGIIAFSATSCSTKESTTAEKHSITQKVDEPAVSTNAEQSPGTMGPFWKVSNTGNVVYLLGSIHVAKPDLYPLHEKIESAFVESEVLAVEADILNINILDLQKEIDQRARYTDGTTLADHLSPFVYAQVKKAFNDYRLNIALFEQYEPWYIAMILDSLQIMQLGYDENLGVDMHFLKQVNSEKEIIELEGIAYQLDLLDQFSEGVQEAVLKASLAAGEKAKEEFEQLFELWKSEEDDDLAAYLTESTDSSKELKEYYEALLDRRNVEMANQIEIFLTSANKKTYFVIVGAAHYVGDVGIVKLLEDKGFIVEKQK